MTRRLQVVAWCAVLLCAAGLLQLLIPFPFDADTGYHIAVARLIRSHGILKAFPWTPFSWLAGHYADKELLFHLLLVPIAGLPENAASRLAGTACAGLLLCALYGVLRSERVERPEMWSLLVLTCSGAFLMRLAMVRPHLLSLTLALCITWAAARRKLWLLGALCFLYPLTYVAWHLALVLVLLVGVAFGVSRRTLNWRTLAVTVGGLAAGTLAHPNFPRNLSLFWVQNFEILVSTAWGGKPGFELGTEFLPFDANGFLRFVLWPALLTIVALGFAWRERSKDPLPLALALAAFAFLGLTLRTQRFLEYLVPFSVAAAAMATRDRVPAWTGSAMVMATLGHLALFGRAPLGWLASRGEDVPQAVGERLRAVVPTGSQIFTCDWGLTGELMLALPERRFLAALDPVFFWKEDPALYELWYRMVRDPPAHVADVIRAKFGARFVLCDDRETWLPFLKALDREPSVTPLLRGQWYLGALGEASGSGATPGPRPTPAP